MVFFDLAMAGIMFGFGIYFYNSKGKAVNLLTEYNMRSLEEREGYNEILMCQSYGRRMMIMSIPFIIGTIIDWFIPGIGCMIAWGGWIIMFVLLLIDRLHREKVKS